MRNGILLIDKPAGMTSQQVVSRVKRILGAGKVGHAGTLDPDATGLLVCLVNGATRASHAGMSGQKGYEGTLRLGVTTSTDDTSGEVLGTCESIPPVDEVLAAGRKLVGPLMQVPPRVSAIRVQGRRAHDLERRGVEFTLEPRPVQVFAFELQQIDREHYSYRVECSPGTYVRSLARDLGEYLGCGGAVETIRRTHSGDLSVRDAVDVDGISWDRMIDWSVLYPGVPRVLVSADLAMRLLGGKEAALREAATVAREQGIELESSELVLYTPDPERETWGILRWVDGMLRYEANVVPQGDVEGLGPRVGVSRESS